MKLLTKTITLVFALSIFLFTAHAHADVYDDMDNANKTAEQAKTDYNNSVKKYEESLSEAQKAETHLAEAKTTYKNKSATANKAAKYLYKTSHEKENMLIELLFTGESLQNIIKELETLNTIFNSQSRKVAEAHEAYLEAQQASEKADKNKQDAEKTKEEMYSAMNKAIEAYDEACEATEKYEAEQATRATQTRKTETTNTKTTQPAAAPSSVESEITMSVDEFLFTGVVYANGYRYTYYSEKVLPGGALNIPGRHTADGMVLDEDGYICVASNDLPKGTVVPTILGRPGKIYDSGCASGTLDLYLA